eukprot:917357_1
MEDWYQCKQNHFKTLEDIRYFRSIKTIDCDSESCVYVRRYQRDRTHRPQQRPHKEIDYKNMILMDELDSIHAFIFHWIPSRIGIIEASPLSHENAKDHGEHTKDAENELTNEIHLWPHGPKPMSQCNVGEIAFLLEHEIVDQVMQLKPHKDEIIKYIKDKRFDGAKLSQTKRKQFALQLVQHFNNNKKLRVRFAKLYSLICDYNNPQYVTQESDHEAQEPSKPAIAVTMNTSKFVTTNNNKSSELSYFALGEQYRYTNNFKRHPLYIQPKFGSLKEEFMDFFQRQLQRTQQQHIDEMMDPTTQLILKDLVTERGHLSLRPLWRAVQTVQLEDTGAISHLIQLNHLNRDIFIIMACLFHYLPQNFAYFDISLFTFCLLLDINLTQLNLRIKRNLNEYIG